jgi:hypothetical protein
MAPLLTQAERDELAKSSAERREALDREMQKAVKSFLESVHETPRKESKPPPSERK